MSKKIIRFFYIALLVGTLFFLAAILTLDSKNTKINDETVTTFNTEWSYSIDGVAGSNTITLPKKIPALKNQTVIITNQLPHKYVEGMTLCFRSVHQFVRVTVDGKQMYQYGYGNKQEVGKSPGNAWNFVRLPRDTSGKTIKIEYKSPYSNYSGIINEVQYGSKNANVFSIIEDNIVALALSALIILIGLVLFICYMFFSKEANSEQLLYLSWFAILAGIWSLCESRMLQFFLTSQVVVTLSAFSSLMLFSVPLLLFIAETHSVHHKKSFYVMSGLFLTNFFIMTILQLTNTCDFMEFPYITHMLIGIGTILIIGTVLIEIIKYKNKKIYILGIGSCVLAITSVFGFLAFHNKFAGDYAYFFRWGVLYYILTLSYYTIKRLLIITSENMQSKVFESLAYTDLLTNLKNRTSFEQEMEVYRKNVENCVDIAIAVCDMNELKLVNDTYGHKEGDEQIQHTADCLKRAFEGKGDVYRIGGDEFAVIMHCVTDEEIKEIFKTFDMFIKQYNIGSTIKLSMAYGFTSFNPLTDIYADDIYVRADKLMYENKVRMKGYRGRRRSDNAENVKGN